MTEAIHIREFTREDVPAVLDLMRVSLGETTVQQRTPELFGWKHFDNPFGPSVILVAESHTRLVGLRTFMRWELQHGGGTIPCGRAVDTATHPDYQRKGIFRRLTMESLDAARAVGIRLIFNTPNERSRPGYLKMGWSQVGSISVQMRPKVRHVVAHRGDTPADPDVVTPGFVPVVSRHLPIRADAAVRRNGASLRATDLFTERTDAFVTWRYSDHPTARYRSVGGGDGAVIVRPNNRRGRWELVISDAFGADPGRAYRQAVHATRGAYAIASFPADSPARRAGRRAGMIPVPGVAAMTLVARPLDPLDIDVLDPEHWRFSLGDLELL